jgi:ABC-type multidrug transport system fused ATPase/permease subunit
MHKQCVPFVLQMGNHEELIVKNGLYAKLNKFQADIVT